MTESLEILYEANKQGIWLWVQNDELKFKSPKNVDVSEILSRLKKNKNDILEILKENKVVSDRVTQPLIYSTLSERCVLSYAQERLWFVEQYEGGSNAYHIPSVYELDSGTNVEGLKYALRKIVSRHEVLRSTIEQDSEGNAVQIVNNAPLFIEEIILSSEEECKSIVRLEIDRPFDLRKEYPIRIKLYSIQPNDVSSGSEKKTVLLINKHHIASDGWSIDIFQNELSVYYEAYINNDETFNLPALEIQYRDYAFWQRINLKDTLLENQLNYWKQRLSGYQTLMLPTDFTRSVEKDYKGAHQLFTISKKNSQKLKTIAQELGVTLNSVMLSAVNILLSKYTGQEDIVIGSPIANRHNGQTQGLIGFFINSLANRTHLNKSQNFKSLIQQVHRDQIEAQQHQDVPFEMIVNELKVERDASRHPVFQVMFGVQNFGKQLTNKKDNWLSHYDIGSAYDVSKFDLTIYIDDANDEFEGVMVYASNLFKKDTIERLIEDYTYLLDQLSQFPQQDYSQINLLSPENYKKIVFEWNENDSEYPKNKTIYQLFYEQEKKTPDNIAIIFNKQKLTYKELNEKSNQLARHIRKEHFLLTGKEVAADTLIALYMDRSLEMIIGILAVLKAGGAYVPIDPEYPQERTDFIIEDTQTKIILTQGHLTEDNSVTLPAGKIIYADLSEEIYNKEENTNLPYDGNANDLAYVMYTSGTTGKPKGVMIEHKAIVNRIYCLIKNHAVDSSFNIASKIPYVFDPSLREIFTALLSGAKLNIISSEIFKNTDKLLDYCINENINFLIFVPSHLTLFADSLKRCRKEELERLDIRLLYSCGEILRNELTQELKKYLPKTIFKNQYGPTECCLFSFEFDFTFNHNTNITVPVGKAIDNTIAYVLDSNLLPVPIGGTGELYIGGDGLSRGYLNRPDLTAGNFIPNPFINSRYREKAYTKLYKTGDLVRWLSDGNLEFIRRNDDQVKMLGHRIELGEIENVFARIGGIKQSCVIVKEKKTENSIYQYIVGYYTLDSADSSLTKEYIIEKLSKFLPEYMLPNFLVTLESFPLTINGKLNKRELPEPDFNVELEKYIAPVTEIEVAVCEIWKDILGVEKVGLTDDFFRIGGNSILAIKLSYRMSKLFGYDVKVADVFKNKTAAQLIRCNVGEAQTEISKTDASSAVLSFAQERLWFIEQYEEGTNAYHVPFVYELNSATDKEGIKYALQKIVSRHEILRTTIENDKNKGHGIQHIHNELLSIEEIILTNKDDCDSFIKQDINRPFNLSKDYPFRVKFYNLKSAAYGSDKIFLLINIHHIACDAWSYFILQKELRAYYEAYCNNDKDFDLPELGIQYKDYSTWQKNHLTDETLSKQLNYWKNKLSGFKTLELPTDYERSDKIDYKGAQQVFTINKETSQKLKLLARNSGTTLNSLMLSSIAVLLNKYTGQDDIVLGSPNANRQYRQTEELIGFFVNTQATRILLKKDQSFKSLLEQVHQDQTEAQLYQDLPFEKLVDELGVKRDASRHSIFQVCFGVLNFAEQNNNLAEQKEYLMRYELEEEYEVERFDLSIRINGSEEELFGQISYATSLFHEATIARFIGHYKHLLDQLVELPDSCYSYFSLITPGEYQQIVYDWNSTERVYPQDKVIHKLFEEQVEKTPDNIAVEYEGKVLTYKELNEKSNQLARHIRLKYKEITGQPIIRDTPIAFCMSRSLEMIIGIMAILKAGGVYVPMDPDYPKERLDYILNDTGVYLILVQRNATKGAFKLPEDKIIHVDLQEDIYKKEDGSNLPEYSAPQDLAYIIYTSGSTGKPKGVMIENRSVINYVNNVNEVFLKNIKNIDFSTNIAFDLTVTTTVYPLLTGKKIHIYSGELKNTDAYTNHLIRNKIDFLKSTPSLLANLSAEHLGNYKIKQAFIGGEKLENYQLAYIAEFVDNLIDEYGPTEATVGTSYINKSLNGAKGIGKPYFNYKTYILDQNNFPVPVGVIGELYIGGAGLSRGYLNRPDLTAERFVPNIFATQSDKEKGYTRLYKTGDLARWLPDGNMEFIGRNDEQVKIRGYRIELGEIEHALMQIEGIKQACVVVREKVVESEKDKYLAAYYVTDKSRTPSDHFTISEKLAEVLPEYMVPTAFKEIPSLPLTANGKLDKPALPEIYIDALSGEYVAPTTEAEITVANIWKEILGLDKVGVTDDFFQIGGNSLKAIRVTYKINKQLNFNIKIADIFRFKTIKELLSAIQPDQKLKLVRPYVQKYNKNLPDIIFVHPGTAGSEVYQDAAELLAEKFNCIGIDNYNLHSGEKIRSWSKLVDYYLSAFEEEYAFCEPINLFGWSMGGRIALEMAAVLETRGHKNINVFLLDTRLPDQISRGIFKKMDIDMFVKDFREHLLESEFLLDHIEKIISALDADFELSYFPVESRLEFSRVILFKAIQEDIVARNEVFIELHNHFLGLKGNNVNLMTTNLEVIEMECYHSNILETKVGEIVNHLLSELMIENKL